MISRYRGIALFSLWDRVARLDAVLGKELARPFAISKKSTRLPSAGLGGYVSPNRRGQAVNVEAKGLPFPSRLGRGAVAIRGKKVGVAGQGQVVLSEIASSDTHEPFAMSHSSAHGLIPFLTRILTGAFLMRVTPFVQHKYIGANVQALIRPSF